MSIKITALYDRLSRDDEQTDTYRPQTHRMHLLTCSHNVLDKETNSAKTKNHGVIKRKVPFRKSVPTGYLYEKRPVLLFSCDYKYC